MIRTDFVSNSSSSSFVVAKEDFDKWSELHVCLCDYSVKSMKKYMENFGYYDTELGPKHYPNGLCNYFYDLITWNNFDLVDDEKYLSRFCYNMCLGLVPLSCHEIVDKFIEKFNEMVKLRKVLPINKKPDPDMKKKHDDLLAEIRNIKEEYFEAVKKMILDKYEDMEVVEFGGSDDEHTIDGYENDEAYARSIANEMSGEHFWRADDCH